MATQSATIGAGTEFTFLADYIYWDGNILGTNIKSDLLPPVSFPFLSTNKYLRNLTIFENWDNHDVYVNVHNRSTGSSGSSRFDMSSKWESSSKAIKITAGSLSIEIPGPAHSSNRTTDATEAYHWKLSSTKTSELRSFITSYKALTAAQKANTQVTLDDGAIINTLFAADAGHDALWGINSATPSSSAKIGDFPSTVNLSGGMAYVGTTLYMVEGTNFQTPRSKLWTVDTSNPSSSTRIGNLPTALSEPSGLATVGTTLYCIHGDYNETSELWIINRVFPWLSSKVGDLPSGIHRPNGLVNFGDTLYCLEGYTTPAIWTINRTTPSLSTKLGDLPSSFRGGSGGLTQHEGRLLATDGRGLWRIHTTNPSASTNLGTLPLSLNNPAGIASSDRRTAIHDPAPPADPTNLHENSVSYTSAVPDWDSVTGATDYTVQWRTSSQSSYPTVNTRTVTASQINLANLASGTTYYWRVKANNSSGSSRYVEDSFTTLRYIVVVTYPGPPQNLSADIKGHSISISWDVGSNATSYRYQWREANGTWSAVASTTTRSFVIPTNGNTSYEWRVQSYRSFNATSSSWVTRTGTTPHLRDLGFSASTETPADSVNLDVYPPAPTVPLTFSETSGSTPFSRTMELDVTGPAEMRFGVSTGTPTEGFDLDVRPPQPELVVLAYGVHSGHNRPDNLWKISLGNPADSTNLGDAPGGQSERRDMVYDGEGFYLLRAVASTLSLLTSIADPRLSADETEGIRRKVIRIGSAGAAWHDEKLISIKGDTLTEIVIPEGGLGDHFANPTLSSIGSLPDDFGEGSALVSHGGVLYAFDANNVWKVNLSDLSSSTNLGSFGDTVGAVRTAASHLGTLYIANESTIFSASIVEGTNSNTLTATSIGTLPTEMDEIESMESYGRFAGTVLGFSASTEVSTATGFALEAILPREEELEFRNVRTGIPIAEVPLDVRIANLEFIANTGIPLATIDMVVVDPEEFSYRANSGLPTASLALSVLEPRNEIIYYDQEIARTIIVYEAEHIQDPEFVPPHWLPEGMRDQLEFVQHILLDVDTGRIALRFTDGIALDPAVVPYIFLDFIDHVREETYGIVGPKTVDNFRDGEYVWVPDDDEPFRDWLLDITPATHMTVRIYWNDEFTRSLEFSAEAPMLEGEFNLGVNHDDPGFESLVVSSDPGEDGLYTSDENLTIDITYGRPLEVTGDAYLVYQLPHAITGAPYHVNASHARLDFTGFVDEVQHTMRFVMDSALEVDPSRYVQEIYASIISTDGGPILDLYTGQHFDQLIPVPFNLDPGVVIGKSPKIRELSAETPPSDRLGRWQPGDYVTLFVAFDQTVEVVGRPGIRLVLVDASHTEYDISFSESGYQNGVATFTHIVQTGNSLPPLHEMTITNKEFILDALRNVRIVSEVFTDVESDYELPSTIVSFDESLAR